MRNLAHMPGIGRIARALLSIQSTFGTTPEGFLDINLSRQDLASYTGTTYETVFRLMNELVQEGSITLSGKNICIADADKLLSHTIEWSLLLKYFLMRILSVVVGLIDNQNSKKVNF